MPRTCCLLFLTIQTVLSCNATSRAEAPLATAIESVINGKDYKHSHWGILIVDAKTGAELYAHDADRMFFPASTTKLYSCGAALCALGADHRFVTPVYARGSVKDGRLHGDLILRAMGDPTLGGRDDGMGRMAFQNEDHIYANGTLTATDPLAGLRELARQVKAAGIHAVEGDVVIDDRLWVKNQGSGSGPRLLTPIVVNDNLVDVLITPAAETGKPATVAVRPMTTTMRIDAQVETVAPGRPAELNVRHAGPFDHIVRGKIAKGAKPQLRVFEVEDPAAFARIHFMEMLHQQGVRVSASALEAASAELPAQEAYGKLTQVAAFTSLPLGELIKVTLKVSHNLYASTLPLLIALKHGKHTLADGLTLQKKILEDLGVDVDSISFAGGAGGANADAVTPRATIQLLRALAKRPDYPTIDAGLPILGVDGTLASAVPPTSPTKGHVRAKTGTLFWRDFMNDRNLLTSKALAGTMTTAAGRTLLICLFVNDVPLPKAVLPAREGKILGHLCEIIYQQAP